MGRRTVGVLTKLDLMDHGTNAMDILSGRVYPLKLGFIGVVNRSQQDIQSGKSLQEALQAEQDFFRHHPAYRNISLRCGTQYLAKTLNTTLMAHIRDRLPDIKARLNTLMGQTQQELASYGNKQFAGKEHRGSLILQLMTRFASSFIASIDGTSSDISTKELCGGARVYYIFNSVFGNSLETIDPTENLTVLDIRTAIRNSTGPRPSLFVPEMAFDLLVKPQIKLLEIPSQRCVELVYEELIKVCHTCGSQELSRFPRLQAKLIEVVSDLLRERLGPCSQYVESLIAIQRAYINTNHPNFLGAAAAMSSVMQSRQERERKAALAEEKKKRERRRMRELQLNGEGPDDDDGTDTPNGVNGANGVHERSLPLRNHSKTARSNSPNLFRNIESGQNPLTTSVNGPRQSFSSVQSAANGGTRDLFLNYFFGKDGNSNLGIPPATAGGQRDPSGSTVSLAMSQRPGSSLASDSAFGGATGFGRRNDTHSASTMKDEFPNLPDLNAAVEVPGMQADEPVLTEREALEAELIRKLISSYFNIVRETIADQVPKAIMHLLVNHSKDVVQNRLVSELYREDLFPELLYEDDSIKAEREKCEKLLETYKKAAKIVGEVL
ncbi:Dynamin- GTPase protein [Ascosphaera aggregata]|nr:Dynamin- GTPase protein [Ascosphaera aggregata]